MLRLFNLLTPKEKARALLLCVGIAFSSLLDAASVASMVSFIAALDSSGNAANHGLANSLRDLFPETTATPLELVAIVLLVLYVVKSITSFVTIVFSTRFVYGVQQRLGTEVVRHYICRPYEQFLGDNISQMTTTATTGVLNTCNGYAQNCITLLTESVLGLTMLSLVVISSTWHSIVVACMLGGLGIGSLLLLKSRLSVSSRDTDDRWRSYCGAVSDGLSSVKELKVLNRENFFVAKAATELKLFSRAMSKSTVLMQAPRILLELTAVSMLVATSLVVARGAGATERLLPTLSLFALVSVRMVPVVNKILGAWQAIAFHTPAFLFVEAALREKGAKPGSGEGLPIRKDFSSVTLSVRSFAYPSSDRQALRDVSVTVNKGERIGIIGKSGSGKSTLVDILLGLFSDVQGDLIVDQHRLPAGRSSLAEVAAYVPQSVYLFDGSFAENIAFGVQSESIDHDLVRHSAIQAGLLPLLNRNNGNTSFSVGDRGVLLSGGERQRVGIARALYCKKPLLVLDEATSALDGETEAHVMAVIDRLGTDVTVIMIAHRLSTVEKCNRVYLLMDGTLSAVGDLAQVLGRGDET